MVTWNRLEPKQTFLSNLPQKGLFCAVNLQGVRCSSYDVIKALGWGFLMNLTASLNSNCES